MPTSLSCLRSWLWPSDNAETVSQGEVSQGIDADGSVFFPNAWFLSWFVELKQRHNAWFLSWFVEVKQRHGESHYSEIS